MANRFLKTLASAFVVENENNDTVDAQSTQGGQAAVPSSPNPQPMNNTTVTQQQPTTPRSPESRRRIPAPPWNCSPPSMNCRTINR